MSRDAPEPGAYTAQAFQLRYDSHLLFHTARVIPDLAHTSHLASELPKQEPEIRKQFLEN